MQNFKEKLKQSSLRFQKTTFQGALFLVVYFATKFAFGVAMLMILMDEKEWEYLQRFQIGSGFQPNMDDAVRDYGGVFQYGLGLLLMTECVSYFMVVYLRSKTTFKLAALLIVFYHNFKYVLIFVLTRILAGNQLTQMLGVISGVVLLSVFFRQLLIQTVWVSYSLECPNKLTHRPNKVVLLLSIIEQVLFALRCYFYFLSDLNSPPTINCYVLDSLLVTTVLIKGVSKFIKAKYYISKLSESFEISSIVCSFFLLLMNLINSLVSQFANIQIDLFEIISLVISLFGILSIFNYQYNQSSLLIYKPHQFITKERQILTFIYAYFSLYRNKESTENELLLLSLHKQHVYRCSKVKCYCREDEQQVPCQKEQRMNHFWQSHLKQVTDHFLSLNISSKAKLIILSFRLELFHDFLNVSYHINSIRQSLKKKLSFQIEIALHSIQHTLQQQFNTKTSIYEQSKFQSPILLDETLQQIQQLIISDINIKSRKWQYLCSALIKSHEIEDDIVKEIGFITKFEKIFNLYKGIFQKSVAFNCLCMFYYAEVVFLSKQIAAIEKNLQKIHSLNIQSVRYSRDIAKNIFDSKFVLLQFNLSKNRIYQSLDLSITNCNRNVELMFKIDQNKFIGRKMSSIFPQFLWPENQKLVFEFVNNHKDQYYSENNFDNYFVDKNGHVFKALQTMKIVPKNDGLHMLMTIFLKETKSIVLLDQQYKIENVGEMFKMYFGAGANNIPFESLFYLHEDYEFFLQPQNHFQYTFPMIFGKQIGKPWKLYVEQIQNFIGINLQQSQKKIHFHSVTESQHKKLTRQQLSKTSVFLAEQKGKLLNLMSYEGNKIKFILMVSFICQKCQINNEQFWQIKFVEFRRRKQTISNSINSTIFRRDIAQQSVDTPPQKQAEVVKEEADEVLELNLNEDIAEMSNFSRENNHQEQEKLKFLHENKSVQSSIKGDSLSYFYRNFIEICFNLFKNPQEISDSRLRMFTFCSLMVSILLCVLVVMTYILFNLGFHEIKDIFFADGAVSDNMQLTELMYNRAMNFKQYKTNATKLAQISQSSFYERQYLMNLVINDVQQYEESKTKMTQTKFYQYLVIGVDWITVKQEVINIQSSDLIVFYYHLLREVESNIIDVDEGNDELADSALKMMMLNFPSLKKINHDDLALYAQLSNHSLNLLDGLFYILGAAHLFLSFIIFVVFYIQKLFRRKQKMQGYMIYKVIPNKIIIILFKYYLEQSLQLRQRSDLKRYQRNFELEGIYLPADHAEFTKQNNSTIVTNNFESPIIIWKFLFVILAINSLYFLFLIKMKQLLVPIDKMMSNVNSLMDSENYLFETYMDFKAKCIIEQNYSANDTFFDNLLESQQSTDVLFGKVSVESLNLFSSYDSTYKTDFLRLLIYDVCDLIKSDVSDYQYNICQQFNSKSSLQNGVLLEMNFFTRKIKDTILMVKQMFHNQTNNGTTNLLPEEMKRIVNSIDFDEIDNTLIFMFKMYQSTQARIYTSLLIAITNLMNFCIIIISIEIIVMGLLYGIFLYWNYKKQKVQLSKLYMSFLLIPTSVSKMIKPFATNIQEILQYDRNNS